MQTMTAAVIGACVVVAGQMPRTQSITPVSPPTKSRTPVRMPESISPSEEELATSPVVLPDENQK
jgi:hypothetical protein